MPFVPDDFAPPPVPEKTMRALLDATETGDYAAFLAPGTAGFKKGISKAMFDSVSRQVAARLRDGYTAQFLAEIKQAAFRVYLWKISFSDGGDEYILRLALAADGKVAGCLLN